jgi:transcription initiation factor TFIIIB Brf1 subunit/transcription initiation factor TFIIB
MGTSNFAHPSNASKYFVVLTNREEEYKECEECNEKHYAYDYNLEETTECYDCGVELPTEIETETQSPHEFEYDDLKTNLGDSIEEIGGYSLDESYDNDRNYNRQSVGKLTSSKSFGDIEVELELIAIIQSAYYEGATLDYAIQIYNGGENVEVDSYSSEDDIIDDLFEVKYDDHYYSNMNKGMRIIQSKNALNWVEKEIKSLSSKLEIIFEQFSEHKLQRQGVFSNGEAVYLEIKD